MEGMVTDISYENYIALCEAVKEDGSEICTLDTWSWRNGVWRADEIYRLEVRLARIQLRDRENRLDIPANSEGAW